MNTASASTGIKSRIVEDLAEVIGERAALDLVWAFRGEMFYVPKAPDIEPLIEEAIGREAAEKLCDIFWGTTMYMPFTEALTRKVIQMNKDKATKKEIHRALHISERRVYRIIERAEKGDSHDLRQPSLL